MLPERYEDPWRQRVVRLAVEGMERGSRVLDIGGGDRPTVLREDRPLDVTYVGLDIDEAGLAQGSYDERFGGSIERRDERLVDRFDVVVSWNTFEHVANLGSAFENIRSYLRPGGTFVTLFAGRWAAFAVAARVMPHAVRVEVMKRLLGANPEHHFPVHYDDCSYRRLTAILAEWGEPVIAPLYRGAGYFRFAKTVQRTYLVYENWAVGHPNLATHYLVTARKRRDAESVEA